MLFLEVFHTAHVRGPQCNAAAQVSVLAGAQLGKTSSFGLPKKATAGVPVYWVGLERPEDHQEKPVGPGVLEDATRKPRKIPRACRSVRVSRQKAPKLASLLEGEDLGWKMPAGTLSSAEEDRPYV